MPHPHTSVNTDTVDPTEKWVNYTDIDPLKPAHRYVYTDYHQSSHHKYVLQQYERHPDTLHVERGDDKEPPSGRPGLDLEFYGRILYNLKIRNTRFRDSATDDLVDVEQKAAKDPHGTYELYKHQHDYLPVFDGYYLFLSYTQPRPGTYVITWHRPISVERLDELLNLTWNQTTHPSFGRCQRASVMVSKLRRLLSHQKIQ